MLRSLTLGVALTLIAGAAQANLIDNGDFELGPSTPGLVNNNMFGDMAGRSGDRSWDVWTALPGWTTQSGNGIEVQTARTIGGADPQSGAHYVELDSHPRQGSNTTMVQTVSLDAGTYRLSYWYQPRTNNAGDNVLAAMFDGVDLRVHDETTTAQGGWVQYFANIDVTSAGSYLIGFAARGDANTFGALLDNVELTQTPIPGALPLLGAGVAGLSFWRRRQRRLA